MLQIYKINKNKYNNINFSGGDIKIHDLRQHDKGFEKLYGVSALLKYNLINNIKFNDINCNANPTDIFFIYGGANGLAFKVKCKNNYIYTVKILKEMSQLYMGENALRPEYRQSNKNAVLEEFTYINRFDHPNIMKATYYFFFEKTINTSKYTFTVIDSKNNKQIIDVETSPNVLYKWICNYLSLCHSSIKKLNEYKKGTGYMLKYFGGLILEFVNTSFDDIPHELYYIMTLFHDYIKGIKYMVDLQIIHKDIKPDNLMAQFNPSTQEITGKIIDLGEATSFSDTNINKPFRAANQMTPSNDDLDKLRDIYRTTTAERKEIFEKYDLHCLAKSFLLFLERHNMQNIDDDFKNLLLRCTISKASDRPSVAEAETMIQQLIEEKL